MLTAGDMVAYAAYATFGVLSVLAGVGLALLLFIQAQRLRAHAEYRRIEKRQREDHEHNWRTFNGRD